MALEQCTACHTLWVFVPWEPYASYPYLVRWEYSPEDWQRLIDLDNAEILHKWHAAKIIELYGTLNDEDKAEMEAHRQRSYGRWPLDRENISLPDLDALLGAA
jgi:hypothetical protein